jgi:hypothetical protein
MYLLPFFSEWKCLSMKFSGDSFCALGLSEFTLQRGNGASLVLRLRPLPLSFQQRLRRRGITLPLPPIRIARDSNGKPLRDPSGSAITLRDLQASDYLDALETYHQAVAALSVFEALQADPELTFESPVPQEQAGPDAWMQFASQLLEEMEQAGFTAGDLVQLCREICRLSNLIDGDLRRAQSSFSALPESHSD